MKIKINRKAHMIKMNKANETPNHIVFIDTETQQIKENNTYKNYFKLGCLIYYRKREGVYKEEHRYHTFNREEFVNKIFSLVKAKTKLYVISHNMHFDFAVCAFMKYLLKDKWKIVKAIVDSNRFYVVIRKDNKTIVFMDNGNIIKTKLEEIGRVVGLEKLHVNFNTVSDDKLIEYCYRDTEILAKFFLSYIDFIKREDLGNFAITIASQAFNAFRHRFMKYPIYVHNDEEVVSMELDSYRGGLCDIFKRKRVEGVNLYKLDVNSMYPYVMRNNPYPVKLVKKMKNINKDTLLKLIEKYLVIADLTFTIKKRWIPLRYNEKLCRVKGKVRACLTSAEILYYLNDIDIEKVHTIAIYESAPIFTEYIDYFYRKREEAKKRGDKFNSTMYKLFMNSLYGKFGQKVREVNISFTEDYDPNIYMLIHEDIDGSITKTYMIEGLALQYGETMIGYDSAVAIASFVTAYARVYLHQLIDIAGEENVYYVDTDSLITNTKGLENLKEYIDEYTLGKLKVEGNTESAEFIAPKHYRFGEEWKIKGVRKDAQKINEKCYKQLRFAKSRGMWRKGIFDYALVEEYERNCTENYDKGIIDIDGNVHPLEVEIK